MTNQNQLDGPGPRVCRVHDCRAVCRTSKVPQKRSSELLDMLRAAAQGYWSEGASHIYLGPRQQHPQRET